MPLINWQMLMDISEILWRFLLTTMASKQSRKRALSFSSMKVLGNIVPKRTVTKISKPKRKSKLTSFWTFLLNTQPLWHHQQSLRRRGSRILICNTRNPLGIAYLAWFPVSGGHALVWFPYVTLQNMLLFSRSSKGHRYTVRFKDHILLEEGAWSGAPY